LVKKRYPLTVVKSIAFTGPVDGKVSASISVISKTEETTTIGLTPNFGIWKPFMFNQTQIKVNDVVVNNVKEWSLTIDNGAIGLRTLVGIQDIVDVIANAKLSVSGGFTVYFENEDERNKFLANNPTSIEIIMTGEEIEAGYNHQLRIVLPNVRYTAYPFGNVDGLLGSSVAFNSYFSIGQQNSISIVLINQVSGY